MTPTVIAATQARIRFGEVLRRVAEKGEVFIVERDGTPQVVVLALNEYERLASTGETLMPWEAALRRAGDVGARIRARRGADLPFPGEVAESRSVVSKPPAPWEEALRRAGDIGARIQVRRGDHALSPGHDSPEGRRSEARSERGAKTAPDAASAERRDNLALPSSSDAIRQARGERDAGHDDSLGVR